MIGTMRVSLPSLQLVALVFAIAQPVTQAFNVFSVFGKPDGEFADLDADVRSILAKMSLESAAGLTDAKRIYEQGGRLDNALPTLQSLGTDAPFTDFSTFQAFSEFFGGDNYAEQYLQAAFDPSVTSLTLNSDSNIEAEFPLSDGNIEGRTRSIGKGVLVLRVWMAVASSLAEAIDLHATLCSTDATSSLPMDAWNKAFALYTGSSAESADPLGGYMLYRFAHEQAEIFGRVAGDGSQEAPVNTEIINSFVQGKTLLGQMASTTDCAADNQGLQDLLPRMLGLLRIPVIQASLRIMYAFDEQSEVRSIAQGEAAVYGMAASGIVSECSMGFASTIFEDMKYGNQIGGSYSVVRGAFERHYECLNISCEDIGGIITSRGDSYLIRGEACDGVRPVEGAGSGTGDDDDDDDNSTTDPAQNPAPTSTGNGSSSSSPPTAAIVIVVLVVVGVLAVLIICLVRRRRRQETTTTPAVTADENGEDCPKAAEVV